MMRLSWFVGLLLFLPHGAGAASADDIFEALDQSLEAEFQATDAELEARFQALDKALEAAFQRVEREIAEEWGEGEVELPDKKQWVDYSEDMATRRKINFESGEVVVERLVDEGDSAADIADSIASAARELEDASTADLSERDLVVKYAREQLDAEGIDYEPHTPPDDRAVVGTVMAQAPTLENVSSLVGEALANNTAQANGVTASSTSLPNGKKKVSIRVPFKFGFESTLASRYQNTVMEQATRHELSPSLVYAVMQTESSFNPRARSKVPAFGLMQLVPRSGAMDAYNHVYGEKVLLDPEYLYDPERNIELGTAYLNLLYTRYLRAVKDPESRWLCAIAAYNTGAGNVARAFVGETSVRKAAPVINAMTPAEVYDHLAVHLPYEETRRYIKKVTDARKKYRGLDRLAKVESNEHRS